MKQALSFVAFCLALFAVKENLAEDTARRTPATTAREIRIYDAKDSLSIELDSDADCNDCLSGLKWTPEAFQVVVREPEGTKGDRLVQFPSAVTTEDEMNNTVSLEWSLAPVAEGETAPAIVVVHESGSSMSVGRIFAEGLRNQKFHTFMIQLPYYGLRRPRGKNRDEVNQIEAMRQAVADVRRARDAVAVLPGVDKTLICLQGTSLGSFVATTAASLDDGYDGLFLMLSGGDLYGIIQNGTRDAAKARERLARQGLEGDKLRDVVQLVEPLRVAHRLDPSHVWLYTGMYDEVVPPENSRLLAEKIGLAEDHHSRMPANHYTGVAFLPLIFIHIKQQIEQLRTTP